MVIPDRLVARMAEVGETQSSLARKVGVSPQMIGKLVRGESGSTTQIHLIAQHLRTTPAYLEGRSDDPDEGAFIPPTEEEIAEQMGLIKVEEVDLALGMGAAYLDESVVRSITRWIPEDWVRQFTDAPASFLTIARPVGESMEPTINDRDIIIIDRSSRRFDRQEGIWALIYGGLGTVKRVRVQSGGKFKLMADNPQVRDEVVLEEEISIIGRVVGVIRRL